MAVANRAKGHFLIQWWYIQGHKGPWTNLERKEQLVRWIEESSGEHRDSWEDYRDDE